MSYKIGDKVVFKNPENRYDIDTGKIMEWPLFGNDNVKIKYLRWDKKFDFVRCRKMDILCLDKPGG